MDDDDLRQGAGEIREQPIAVLDLLVAFAQRVEQAIDGVRELRRFRIVRHRQASADRGILATLPAFHR